MRHGALSLSFMLLLTPAPACVGTEVEMTTTPSAMTAATPLHCEHRVSKAVHLSAEEAVARHGFGARRFSQAPSSHERPIEVCGVGGEVQWLVRVKCDDGTNPFTDERHAHRARVGSLGGGGRCASRIDVYKVVCPEDTYDVHMDLYMCGPGESL
jgi:hypothetical protein